MEGHLACVISIPSITCASNVKLVAWKCAEATKMEWRLTAHEVEQAADFAGVEFAVLAGGEIA